MKLYTLILFSLIFSQSLWAQIQDTASVKKEIDSLILVQKDYLTAQKYDEAIAVLKIAESKCVDAFGKESMHNATIQNSIGVVYYYQNDLQSVLPFWELAKEIREKLVGTSHPKYGASLNNLSVLYSGLGEFNKADSLLMQSLKIQEDQLEPNDPQFGSIYANVAIVKMRLEKYDKAEEYFLKSLNILKETTGEETTSYAAIVNNLSILYKNTSDYDRAIEMNQKALDLYEKIVGKDHNLYARSMGTLGNLYMNLGDYTKAENSLLEALRIMKEIFGEENKSYINIISNVGIVYKESGDLLNAEKYYLKALNLIENLSGKDNLDYARNLGNLATLHETIGNTETARDYNLESIAIIESILGKENTSYALRTANLANTYADLGEIELAEKYYKESLAIHERVLGKNSHSYGWKLNNLASIYQQIGRYEEAEILFLEMKELWKKNLGEQHPDYAYVLNNISILYNHMDRFEEAEDLALKAIDIRKDIYRKEHPDYLWNLSSLASLYKHMGRDELALPLVVEANQIEKKLLLRASHHLSQNEMQSYTAQFVLKQNKFLSFVQHNRGLADMAYDNTLLYKGFLLNSLQKLERLSSKDSVTQALKSELKSINKRIAKNDSKQIKNQVDVTELELRGNQLEKKIAAKVSGYEDMNRQINWQQVQVHLEPAAAAIEFVHYQYTPWLKTDTVQYAAIIITHDQAPKFIPLFEEKYLSYLNEFDGSRRADYVNSIYEVEDRGAIALGEKKESMYKLIWEPIEKELSGIKKIYFSPSGLLHRINIPAIGVDAETNLGSIYQMIQLNSTRSLAFPEERINQNNNAVLFGGISYDSIATELPSTELSFEAPELEIEEDDTKSIVASYRGGNWSFLKWTQKEIESIYPILESSGFNTLSYNLDKATEEKFKDIGGNVASPKILHLATHGYFFNNPEEDNDQIETNNPFKNNSNPMFRSGLLLSGANKVWGGESLSASQEDGVLTAFEISHLDLSNTELVVLSACETGLGDIYGNEGVYGLQRAFKIAGAKYLIMSLWQVPDRQTKDFMVQFYSNWLEEGLEIPEAFRKTQLEMKERFYDPYNWAGFVLVE